MTNTALPTPQTPANEVKPLAPAVTADKPEQKKTYAPAKAMRGFDKGVGDRHGFAPAL